MPLLAPVTTAVLAWPGGLGGLSVMAAIVVAHLRLVTATTLVRLAGIVGGLGWVARAVLDTGDGPSGAIHALHYAGLALLVIALLGIGAGLVSGLLALRVVVAICLLALAWAVVSFLHTQYSDRLADGVLGGLMAAYCAVGLLTRRSHDHGDEPPAPRRSRGSHAA
jgi:uncharacterized membrane protein AbrB (regulator of aidB expression)